MTEAKGTRRRRRTGSAESDIPRDLAEWFAGERAEGKSLVPWSALIFPDYALLHERWHAWKEQNPGARPPPGYERLDEPLPLEPLTEHRQKVLDAARRIVRGRAK